MRHLTIRNVPEEVAAALEEEKRRRGLSLTRTVIELLRQALGLGPEGPPGNGLADLAGTWSEDELAEFEEATACTEEVDGEHWR